MLLPFWMDVTHPWCRIDRNDDWEQSKSVAIVFRSTAVISKLMAAPNAEKSHFDAIEYVFVHSQDENEAAWLISKCPNLLGLYMSHSVGSEETTLYLQALNNCKKLKQLTYLMHFSDTAFIFFSHVDPSHLTALSLTINDAMAPLEDELCAFLLRAANLRFLELLSHDLTNFPTLFAKLAKAFSTEPLKLESFSFECDENGQVSVAQLLNCMPLLTQLQISCAGETLDAQLLSYLSRSALTQLTVGSLNSSSSDYSTSFFSALKDNRQLQSLVFKDVDTLETALVSSGLLDMGLITQLECVIGKMEHADRLVARNRSRHANCRRICMTLLVLRKRKLILTSLSIDVVRHLAKFIWQERGSKEWDT